MPYVQGDDDSDSEDDVGGWIQWYCSLKGNELLLEIDEDYIQDSFNLYGLKSRFSFYDLALDQILAQEAPDEEDMDAPRFSEIYQDAAILYGLIHARFIISPRGLSLAHHKYRNGEYGVCPRSLCKEQRTLPVGIEDNLPEDRRTTSPVKLFCPKCEGVYACKPKNSQLLGCYFGTSFPHVFLQAYPDLVPTQLPKPYVPRIFGFRVHNSKGQTHLKLEAKGDYGMRDDRDDDPRQNAYSNTTRV